MDVSSKQLMISAALDTNQLSGDGDTKVDVDMYKTSVDDIDRRYRVEFGTLEIKTKEDSDDPMGLHAVAEGEQKKDEYENSSGQASAQAASLDAVVKGKGKGKGKNDGRCNIVNGESHFTRDCSSTPPVFAQAVKCHGCHGRGHYKGQCPTANPHLKQQKGQGKGWGGDGKGQGYGEGAGGKGYGGKGYRGIRRKGKWKRNGQKGGIYEVDVMGGQWSEEWGGDNWNYGAEADTGYLRSLATLAPAQVKPIDVSNRYEPLDESFEVPVGEVIVESTRKPKNKKKDT
jgi:hypothetical protein